LSNTEVSKKLGELWRNAPEEERAPHISKEKAEREAYKVSRDAWQEKYDKKMEEQNRIQAEQAKEQAQAQAAMMYNNAPQLIQPNDANLYNYADPMAHIGYNPNMPRHQNPDTQYLGQQQTIGHFYNYSFGAQGYPCKALFEDSML
jgi:hypothetical protein